MQRKADVSGIFNELVALVKGGIKGVVLYVFLVGGLGVVGTFFGLAQSTANIVSVGGGYTYQPGDGIAQMLFGLATTIVSFLASYSLIAYLLDQKARLPKGSTRIWAYVGMTILTIVGLIVGFVLLIVPGFILLVRWSASSGYLIEGRRGVVDALSDSWDATRGSGWQIFAAGLLTTIGLAIFGMFLNLFWRISGSTLLADSLSHVTNAIGNSVFIAFGIAVYLLVSDKSESLAEVFD